MRWIQRASVFGVVLAGSAIVFGGRAGIQGPTTKPTSIFDFGLEPQAPIDGDKDEAPKGAPKVAETPAPAPADDAPPKPAAPSKKPSKAAPPPDAVASNPPAKTAGPAKSPPPAPQKNVAPPSEGASRVPDEFAAACHVDPQGVITVDRDVSLSFKGTEGKHFIITGEMYPTEAPVLFNTGAVIFHLRELNGKKRYELSINGMRAKRIMLEGQEVKKFAWPMKFEGIAREQWHTFRVDASADAIAVQFDNNKGEAKGPLETGGSNSIVLGPGAKLRKIKIEVLDR